MTHSPTQYQELSDLLQQIKDDKTIVAVLKTFVYPVAVALIIFYINYLLKEFRERKRYSLIGKAILESLLEEVTNGIKIMNSDKNNNIIVHVLPKGSWDGITTIPEQTLERLLMLKERSEYSGFPVKEIRIHTKTTLNTLQLTTRRQWKMELIHPLLII